MLSAFVMPLPAARQKTERPPAHIAPTRPQKAYYQERIMSEFFRSGAIMLMGLTVMAAGVVVVFYG